MNFTYAIEREGVAIQNLSFDPQGRIHQLERSRIRRWWQKHHGWTHYIGSHYLAFDDQRLHLEVARAHTPSPEATP